MSGKDTLRAVLDKLKSDKIKDRQEGLTLIRETFTEKVIAKWHINANGGSDPKLWLPVFQALFSAVIVEKTAVSKKSTSKSGGSSAAALRRLSEAASIIRWLTERSVQYMNKKVSMAIFHHLTQTLTANRTSDDLFALVALDYAKALKCLVGHEPHLEHLDDEMWVRIVELSFNVVLGNPINSKFAREDDEENTNEVDSDMYMDDDTAGDPESSDVPASITSNSRKRSRPPESFSPMKSKPFNKPRRNTLTAVSLEQIEFTSILSIMISSPTAPLLSTEYPRLASGILLRLEQFLERYPSESSILHDYLTIVSATLHHLTLNMKDAVEKFARSIWPGIVALWGTKDKSLKESLTKVLRALFPLTICPSFSGDTRAYYFDTATELGRLRDLLDSEAESRWGVDGLALNSLRLQVNQSGEVDVSGNSGAFVAQTFRAGWNFDSEQALSWAISQLQADCIGKLYQLSESMDSTATGLRSDVKRIKLVDPISVLLNAIQATSSSRARTHRLQTLLFFIDRHWSALHGSHKGRIVNVLLQYVASDDSAVQSWVFLNLAAIAFAEKSQADHSRNHVMVSIEWESIWTHSIRRANVPAVSRAACHAGHSLLVSIYSAAQNRDSPLAPHRVLMEIETLMKDIDVQGPPFPFDSVCIFLSKCLAIASQDVRLYRMRLEDKALGWLIDTWKVSANNKMKMTPYMVQDILLLLETICAWTKRVNFLIRPLLPSSSIVDCLMEETRVKIIEDYVLYAKLQSFDDSVDTFSGNLANQTPQNADKIAKIQLLAPKGRERKISAFLLRALEFLTNIWDSSTVGTRPTAEMVRESLDLAIAALAFESLLAINGVSSNRQVVQGAARLISSLSCLLTDPKWTTSERLLVVDALEVLIDDEIREQDDVFRHALSAPGHGSGIKEHILKKLLSSTGKEPRGTESSRLEFLRCIWQNSEMHDTLAAVTKALRLLLTQLVTGASGNSLEEAMDIDDRDGFGPIRVTNDQSLSLGTRSCNEKRATLRLMQLCVGFIACGAYLQSPSSEPSQDKELTQLLLDNADLHYRQFNLLCPVFLDRVRQGVLRLPWKSANAFFNKFGSMLGQYAFARNEALSVLIIDLLTSVLGVWRSSDTQAPEVHKKFRSLCRWLSEKYVTSKMRAWTVRDRWARFLDHYLSEDPTEHSWFPQDEETSETLEDYQTLLPSSLLQRMNADSDLRVRFRVSRISARLISSCRHVDKTPLEVYMSIQKYLTGDVANFEYMLTRMLTLGNVMIVSSEVRRGPYWHLLETCVYSQVYIDHIEAILSGIAERLGMPSLATLFEAYASQLAYSFGVAQKDFMSFPPHLLGYKNKKQYAEATFRAFTPTNVITGGIGRFENHCKVIQKTVEDGLRECFGDIVGFQIGYGLNSPDTPQETLDQIIQDKMAPLTDLSTLLQENLDGVVVQVLRCLGEQDCSENGPICLALRSYDQSGKMARIFASLTSPRGPDLFQRHQPNPPAFPASVILESLSWLSSHSPNGFSRATTYHVVQELAKDIYQSPLINEQSRLINALALWLAYRNQDLEDPTVAPTVAHVASILLSQSDLANATQSILDYVFRMYRKYSIKDHRLPNLLVRICSIAHEYASDTRDLSTSEMGNRLMQWIEMQVCALAKSPTLKPLVLRALPAWPREPSEQVASLNDENTLVSLASVLDDHRITANKFRLVHRLLDYPPEQDEEDDTFATTTFWRLKECLPPSEKLQEEDIAAFSELLFLHHGKLKSFTVEPNLNDARSHHRRLQRRRELLDSTSGSKDAIINGLLLMLGDDEPSRVSKAYDTLRLLNAVPSFQGLKLQISAEYRDELEFFKVHLRTPRISDEADIYTSLNSDTYLDATRNFPQWITLLTVLFSDTLAATDPFFGQLVSICSSDISFAEEILPILVYMLLAPREGLNTGPGLKNLLSKYFTSILSSTTADISCIRSVVDIALHLRYFLPKMSRPLAYNDWLEIDYTLLAKSAIICGAYTTALLFVELASERSQGSEGRELIESVLYDIYAHIDEPDGFYGIKTQDLHQFLIKRFHHEHQWDKAFQFHGAALETGVAQRHEKEGLLESFHSFGFDHLAIDTLRNLSSDSPDSTPSSMNYKLGWRTETWDLPDQTQAVSGVPLYRSLRAIYRERDLGTLDRNIHLSLSQEMTHLRSLVPENLVEIRTVSRDLMCLYQVLCWRRDSLQELLHTQNTAFDQWKDFIRIDGQFEFSDLESIMATRVSLLRSVRQREERQQIGNLSTPFVRGLKEIEQACLIRLSEAARESQQVQIALNSVIRAQRLDAQPSATVVEEFANVLWLQKEEKLAVQFLQNLVEQADPSDNTRRALWLSRLGTWTSEACLAKPTEIWERYFSPSISLLLDGEGMDVSDDTATVYRQCAMFAERQYHATLKSPDVLRWKIYVERKQQEIEQRDKELAKIYDKQTRDTVLDYQSKAEKLLREDSELFKRHHTLRETFLKQALEMHSRCLVEKSSKFDNDSAIRFCSLWLANFDDPLILDCVKTSLDQIPSRKLLFLAHQLTARLSDASSAPLPPAQINLQNLIIRMCQEHPFHSLYQVYCISDHTSLNATTRRQSMSNASQATQTDRGTAATSIMDRLRSDPTRDNKRVKDLERLCDASLQWAKFPIKGQNSYKNRSGPFPIPSALKILSIENLRIPVTTARTPVDPTMKYDNCVWIQRYDPSFNTAGGVNMPKITICIGSDGQQYKQLFKGEGKDDLRQDAVMEQVFELVNSVLKQDRETRRRELRIRDYKVVPLASQAGVIEFVGNTSPLKEWLHSAHSRHVVFLLSHLMSPRYRPMDEKVTEFTAKLRKVQEAKPPDPEEILQTFVKLKKRFRPVFRHYFTEKHKTPLSWFQMRLRYTRSTAAASIVGHVLGLGDRHTSNILLDNVTGEVVHIDLGIAFDQYRQGKLLPVPERVPFRMTEDVVDGMGISGTSGVFQRCAEETLRVLREESDLILTILEVFKHDPLHSWTASEVKVRQAQSDVLTATTVNDATRFNLGIGIDMSSGTADEAADRALNSVARKLDKSLSVESTVNELIAEATDVTNLATIFYGWQPHV
ncbi:hypothetical protein CVT26_003417 [Gymnopilus dilepis]|uniref:Serine/threonine-protein kinase Tel1 n=1 Tax=Gymnopilus dilepis TaxID=231916 RepID=A0A409Y5D6_9AGAR|nr:hypothetical protein CVT26_003417 [Gymnopilus dilepis]